MSENYKLSDWDQYEIINACDSFDELRTALETIGFIKSRNPNLNKDENGGMINKSVILALDQLMAEINSGLGFFEIHWNYLTRTYGIRQQAMYIYRYKS